MNTTKTKIKINIVIMLMLPIVVATLGLSGCAEPDPMIPAGIDQGWRGVDIRQVFDVYVKLVQQQTGKTVGITKGVQKTEAIIKLKQNRPMTRSEAIQLIEQCLRDQAGVVVVHRDRKHIIFGLSGNPDKQPVQWFSRH